MALSSYCVFKDIENIKTLGIIPARMNSSRFPGKPLAMLGGMTVIERVCRNASAALDRVVVATDSDAIVEECRRIGVEVFMTSARCNNGTERCLEAYRLMGSPHYDIIFNIQADEPLVSPRSLEMVVEEYRHLSATCDSPSVMTLVRTAQPAESELIGDRSVVKVVTDCGSNALYFSRLPIPYMRDLDCDAECIYKVHIGVYAFAAECFDRLATLKPATIARCENLEQLTWLYNGYKIKCVETDDVTVGIDTPADISLAEKILNRSNNKL